MVTMLLNVCSSSPAILPTPHDPSHGAILDMGAPGLYASDAPQVLLCFCCASALLNFCGPQLRTCMRIRDHVQLRHCAVGMDA